MRHSLAFVALLACASAVWSAAEPHRDISLAKLPVEFEANRGQHDASVRFLSRAAGYQVGLTSSGAVFALPGPGSRAPAGVVTLRFNGSSPAARPMGQGETAHRTHYLRGEAADQQFADIPNFERVVYRALYPGIDAVFYGRNGDVEYDLVLQPGADPGRLELSFSGATKIELDERGDLLLHTPGGVLRQHKPVVYQERNGRREAVASRYRIARNNKVRFDIAAYDAKVALTVDPVLSYSTHLGGSTSDIGNAIAVDAAGNAYVTGQTYSTNFPVAGAYQGSMAGTGDVFVAKLNPQGTGLVYSTYIGGRRSISEGKVIAVDASGSAYVAGLTNSTAYPVTAGAYSAAITGGGAFVTKLSPAGNALAYSTYLRGVTPTAIKVDAAGNAYVAGSSFGNLPTTAGAFQTVLPGTAGSGSLTKLNAAGSALVFSTYLGGGNGENTVNGLALDTAANAYLVGTTTATNFPVTAGAFQPALQGGRDAFVAKVNATGSGLVFATYLGGATDDNGMAVAVDANGKVYAAGYTESTNFPRVNGYFKTLSQYDFVTDAFITVFNPDGASLLMSTYLGGRACLSSTVNNCSPSQPNDGATAIAVDPSGTHIFVAGFLSSVDVNWLTDAIQAKQSGGKDAFLAKIEVDPFSQRILNIRYGTRLGGNAEEQANGIGVDAQGNAYVSGTTYATDFPTTAGALRVATGGAEDVFVAKVGTLGVPVMLEGGCDAGAASNLRASVPLNVAGTVAFLDGATTVATAPIQNGQAIATVPAAVGTHKYTAVRSSDGAASKPVYCKVEQ